MPMPRLLVDENVPAPATQALRPAEPAAWPLPLLARPEEIEGYFCVWRRDGMRKRPLPGGGR